MKAVQELSATVDILERRIEELEYEKSSTLGMLEKRIYELETEKETITVGMKD